MDQLLNILFFWTHVFFILFNLFGLIWAKTRKLHLWTILLTLCSWLVLGIWFGFGYCFLTDWHWAVKRRLGETDLPNSFIQYLFDQLGVSIHASTTDTLTLIVFCIALISTLYFNFLKKSKTK